ADRLTPTRETRSASFAAVAAGNGLSCGVRTGRSLWCWGDDTAGELGVGRTPGQKDAPVAVGSADFAVIRAGGTQSCGLHSDGSLWCWGLNDVSAQSAPTQVLPSKRFLDVAPGGGHVCALRDPDGSLWCFGGNAAGQLGDGTNAPHPTPERIGTSAWLA